MATEVHSVNSDGASKTIRLKDAVTAVADYSITWTANEPTAGDSATIADGDTPTVAESGQAIADLTAKLNLVLEALRVHGIVAR